MLYSQNYPPVRKSRKRTYLEMKSQPVISIHELPEETFISKKKKFRSEIREEETLVEIQSLFSLQSEMDNLKLRNVLNAQLDIEDVDMPEICEIPLNKQENFLSASYYVDDDADTNNSSVNFDFEGSVCKDKIKGKLIDNAIETEKTMRKYFDILNPTLQPTKENGLILFQEMKKLQNKFDSDLLVNFVVNSYKENQRKKDFTMEISETEYDLESLAGGEFFNYEMYID